MIVTYGAIRQRFCDACGLPAVVIHATAEGRDWCPAHAPNLTLNELANLMELEGWQEAEA